MALLMVPSVAPAHNYTFLEGNAVRRDVGPEEDVGVRLSGSMDVTYPVALFGEYISADEYDQFSTGGLFHTALNHVLDLNLGASLESVDDGRRDDTGLGLRGGVRWQAIPTRLEVNPEIRHVDVFDTVNTNLRVTGLYFMDRHLDLLGVVQGGDDDRIEAGIRYNFGPRMTGR
jgi:hypothetical protein